MSDSHRASEDIDWAAIERSEDFRALTRGRRRFAWTAGSIGLGLGALYIVLAGVAPDLMGTKVFGSMSLGFAGGVGLILVTWAITLLYVRRSDREWGPLEERIRQEFSAGRPAEPRFERAERSVRTRAPR